MSERRIRHGGLMRCCVTSVHEYDGPEVPGETMIRCTYEGQRWDVTRIRLADDGVWEWQRDELVGAML